MKELSALVRASLGVLVCVIVCLIAESVAYAADSIVADTFPLNIYQRKLDGQWSGTTVASDGKAYFGSSTHAYDAAGIFCQYDPTAQQVTVLSADLSATCGEDAVWQVPQGKLHSDIVESNGWLYFATHLANYWPEAQDVYTGYHIVGYELGSAEAGTPNFRDLGIPRARYSNYAGIQVDPTGQYIYTTANPFADADQAVSPMHVYRTEIATGTHLDLGPAGLNGSGKCDFMFMDGRGDVWFTNRSGDGDLFVVRSGSTSVESYSGVLPTLTSWVSDVPAANQDGKWWRWGSAMGDGDRYLFTMRNSAEDYGGALWEFNSAKMAVDPAQAFRKVAFVGPTDLGMALGPDRVYYLQRSDGAPSQAAYPPDTQHLWHVLLDGDAPNRLHDYGEIVDADGRTPMRLPAFSTDGEGQLYMTGDWNMLGSDPVEYRMLRHDGGTSTSYSLIDRGEMFAVVTVEVPEPTTSILLLAGAGTFIRRRRAIVK